MSKVIWTRKALDKFTELAMLTELEVQIIETRVKGMTISQQAIHFGMSESSVCRVIKNIKKKYDEDVIIDNLNIQINRL